jgi:hypothetical protein
MNNVMAQVDFQYDLINDANALILTEEASSQGFYEPLRFAGAGPIREAPAEIFGGASSEPVAAVIRELRFGGARRTTYLTQV